MANDDLVHCANLREEEWAVLCSAFPEYTEASTSAVSAPGALRLEIPVELNEQEVEIASDLPLDVDSLPESPARLRISNLPPLILELIFPSTYPLRATPLLARLHTVNTWLTSTEIGRIRQRLIDIWEEDLHIESGTLWRTCEWIRSADFLHDLGLMDGSVRLLHPKPHLLAQRLQEHDAAVKFRAFSDSKFDCAICLTSLKGSKCIQLNCKHVFCRPCLTDFWSLHIKEGDVDRVMCADAECVKANRPVTEDELSRVVSEAETQRWKAIKRKRALETDPGLVYCPIAVCQGPCPSPNAQRLKQFDLSSVDDVTLRRNHLTLRTCENCGFAFCMLCKRSWHGLAPCSSDIKAKFVQEYMELEDGSEGRLALERRFGKAQLVRLVTKFKEEMETENWLKSSTTNCPNCSTSVEKSMGCNHMTCTRCSTHFCYLCGQKLRAEDPYSHFSNDPNCKGRLFEANGWEEEDDEDFAADPFD
ncbi:SubName: Full=Related to ring finger protein 14 {ECO:0000313/EMBL:CCA75181.1} [Serendipita indica DSM 11827]|uniref:RBR-type E3 ubiquitin transferase n=1 Tax=Serendipita indica (strain DSM 11827) TaxID=1109443 RepID=G4TV38_SERID|nr:SubName: Full=Related to ring finger protein 14 {ECO:0000313/EMBL:CCA75181.1} [Serendipita indica DSM 11827]CCA75181.1 related to ring finger protein 14 [Serendipita indica DSM 11827]